MTEKIVIEHFRERLQKGEYMEEREAKPLPVKHGGILLEVGCGTRVTYFSEGLEICGVDILPEMIKLFEKRYPEAHGVVADVKRLPFRKESFDVIVSNALLHHLVGKNPKESEEKIIATIKEIKGCLKNDGAILVIELISKNRLFSLLAFYVTLFCAKFQIDINFFDIHSKVITFFLTKKDFMKIAWENGLKVKEIESKEWKIKGFKVGEINEFLLAK